MSNEFKETKGIERTEGFRLEEGLNAVLMPDLGKRDEYGNPKPLQAEETLKRLQTFLDEIEKQGGEIVGVVPVAVHLELSEVRLMMDTYDEERQVFIVRKG